MFAEGSTHQNDDHSFGRDQLAAMLDEALASPDEASEEVARTQRELLAECGTADPVSRWNGAGDSSADGRRCDNWNVISTRWAGVRVTAVAIAAVVGLTTSCARRSVDSPAVDPALATTIADVDAGRANTPLVIQPGVGSEATVTFLVKSTDEQTPRIVSDVTGWGESPDDSFFDLTVGEMTNIGSTGWHRLETTVAPRARIEYLVVRGETDYRVDPHNPRRAWSRGGGPVSEFATPDWTPPPALSEPHVARRGRTVASTIETPALDGERRVTVYLPPGYRDGGDHPVAVFHSGWRVARDGEAPRVLDWLIAHRDIEPTVVIFLDSYLPGDSDNHEGPPMRTFLTREVPAWARARFGISARPEDWAVLAISYGAKDAVDAALAPAGTYGRVGLLIPGRRLTPPDLERLCRPDSHRLRVAILAGRYDAANIATAQMARDALTGAGHDVIWIEVPEGHNPTTWRDHLGDVFVSLFGSGEPSAS